jgi:hypothetical protein
MRGLLVLIGILALVGAIAVKVMVLTQRPKFYRSHERLEPAGLEIDKRGPIPDTTYIYELK